MAGNLNGSTLSVKICHIVSEEGGVPLPGAESAAEK
jgi:hypothetical protein